MPNPDNRPDASLRSTLETYREWLRHQLAGAGVDFERLCGEHPEAASELRQLHTLFQLAQAAAGSATFHPRCTGRFPGENTVTSLASHGTEPRSDRLTACCRCCADYHAIMLPGMRSGVTLLRQKARRLARLATAFLLWAAYHPSPATADATGAPIDYVRDIKPIFETRCSSCHGRWKQKAGLRLDAGKLIHQGSKNGAVILPGHAAESLLIKLVTITNLEERMPLEEKPLSQRHLTLLHQWIDEGAVYPAAEKILLPPEQHWAFQPVRSPSVPPIRNSAWARNPIDHFILAKLEERQWLPANAAGWDALFRRVYLDLIGLPPGVEEQGRFLQAPSAQKLDEVIDHLLAQPGYGERWARHWLDLVRYADSNGYERATPPSRLSGATAIMSSARSTPTHRSIASPSNSWRAMNFPSPRPIRSSPLAITAWVILMTNRRIRWLINSINSMILSAPPRKCSSD